MVLTVFVAKRTKCNHYKHPLPELYEGKIVFFGSEMDELCFCLQSVVFVGGVVVEKHQCALIQQESIHGALYSAA